MSYDLKAVIETACRNGTERHPYVFNVVTLTNAREQPVRNRKLRVISAPRAVDLIDGTKVIKRVDMGRLLGLAGSISNTGFARTQYAKVQKNGLFEQLYDVKDRLFEYVEAGKPVQKQVPSAPCMICGLVLPLRNLTIDHQRPQKGGEIEAVLKTFRAFGLTLEGPGGPKGQAILAHVNTGKALAPLPTQPGRDALGGGAAARRYSLNEDGMFLYSFVAAANQIQQLKDACMHGLLNLKPACGACNSSKGNPVKF